jgi:nitrogen fixation NifU-like protein
VSDLEELYGDMIKDHSGSPRNFRQLADADRVADGYNPLCGDKVKVFLKIDGDRIADVTFLGKGCAISTASASVMTQLLKGKSIAEASSLFHHFHDFLLAPPDQSPSSNSLGKLDAFRGVRKYPVRVKCATLPWHTLNAALEQRHEVVSTE